MATFDEMINGLYVTMYNRTADSGGFNWATGQAGLPTVAAAKSTTVDRFGSGSGRYF
jgi:hypothetical protein